MVKRNKSRAIELHQIAPETYNGVSQTIEWMNSCITLGLGERINELFE